MCRTERDELSPSVEQAKEERITDVDMLEATDFYKTPRGQKPHRATGSDVPVALTYLQSLIEPIGEEAYGLFEAETRQRLRGRDEDDWPVLASALSLAC